MPRCTEFENMTEALGQMTEPAITVPALALVANFCTIHLIDGQSMQPTLNPNPSSFFKDIVFLEKISCHNYEFKRGQIVAFVSPRNPKDKLIKRIIGLEGDCIKSNKYDEYIHIPKGHCWVEGDRSVSSLDSNYFGPIPLGLITSRALIVIWPLNKIRKLDETLPPGREPVDLYFCYKHENLIHDD